MNKKKLALSMALGAFIIKGAIAGDGKKEVGELDLNSIKYIEEEQIIELGFDTADYLPEGFDPYAFYFDLDWIEYSEESELEEIQVANHLPKGFDAYTIVIGIEAVNYIDPSDEIELDFDPEKLLPEDFDRYEK